MGEYAKLEVATASQILAWATATFPGSFGIATSFQKEGMIILDLASRLLQPFRVFTLDTGRLPEDTYRMMDVVRERYGVSVEVVFPDAVAVQELVSIRGPNLFYEDIDARRLCCEVRKTRPLERKLREFEAWATGLRREQSDTRASIAKVETVGGRLRLCPLADWTGEQVDRYIDEHHVPVHPLYRRGYTSIGCAPCTRAVRPGETERSGRWWWEQDTHKECGIHFSPDGLVRHA